MECGCHANGASSNYTIKDSDGDDNDYGDDNGDNGLSGTGLDHCSLSSRSPERSLPGFYLIIYFIFSCPPLDYGGNPMNAHCSSCAIFLCYFQLLMIYSWNPIQMKTICL